MSEILRSTTNLVSARTAARITAPVPVMIAGTALIATRCLDVVMLFNAFGVDGIQGFVHASSRSWALTGLFLAGLTMLFLQIRCGVGVLSALPWTRWCYLGCQLISSSYLFYATWRGLFPEMYMLPGDSASEILSQLVTLKLPDMLMLALLFLPASSRRFFASQR